MKLIYITFIGLLCFSCTQTEEEKLHNYMIGDWETKSSNFIMPTLNNTDSLSVSLKDYTKLSSEKSKSSYKKDSTFTSWHEVSGKKTAYFNGKWANTSDSLFLYFKTTTKEQIKMSFLITKTSEGFHGKSIYDYDNDGKVDDTLYVKVKKLDL